MIDYADLGGLNIMPFRAPKCEQDASTYISRVELLSYLEEGNMKCLSEIAIGKISCFKCDVAQFQSCKMVAH